MPVYLDVESRLDERALAAVSRKLIDHFAHVGNDISKGLGSSLSKEFGALDGSAARQELLALQQEFRRTADVEADAAARMIRDQRRVAEATAKYGDDSSKAAAAQAVLARSQRDHVDAMVAAEAAHGRLAKATDSTADSVSRLQRLGSNPIFNAVGIGSVAAMGVGLVDFGKKAGDFQASQERLVASAGETTSNLKAVSDGILQLAGQVGYSAQDLSNAMYSVEKAGYRGAAGVNVLKAASQGAKSENSELGEVLNGLTTSMNDFGYNSDQAADVMSKMVTATSLAKTNFQDFSGSLHSAEPLIANIGKSQGLNAGQMHHLMADLYGLGAQMTQTGDSAQHAFQLIGHAASKMLGPTAGMRAMMGSLGIDAQDVTDHLGERGLTGTLQLLQKALQAHTKNGIVDLNVHYQSAQAARAEAEAFAALPGPAKAVAQEIKDGTLSYKEFRRSRGGLNVEMANEVNQWNALNNKLTGYSDLIKSGIGDHVSYDQALKILTGDQETLQVALQASGENADAVNKKIQAVDQTTREHDGTVKGFTETQTTLNAKMADAKAAFGAAAIEIGSAFVPVMTDVANVAKTVGDELSKHPAIAHDVVMGLEAIATAWLTIKAINIASTILGPITSGLGAMATEEDAAAESAGGLRGALSGIAGVAGPVVGASVAADQLSKQAEDSHNPVLHYLGDAFRHSPVSAYGLYNLVTGRHAAGGPLHAPGPKGVDSALFWGADGEHVIPADEVDAAGGHAGVYAWRAGLHREGGGPLGRLYAEAQALNGGRYVWGSTDCSGAVSLLVDAAVGGSGRMNTGNAAQWLQARGFLPGLGPPGSLQIGWYNGGPGGGHMAATLPDGTHFESGGQHGGIMLGGGAAGAESSEFSNHMYLPMQGLYPDGPGGAGGGMGRYGGGFGGTGGFGGGGVPAGGTPGTGPGGQPGYYTANPERVASARESLRHLDAEIANAEERKKNLKADASQAERDRLNEEIRHLKQERILDEERLQKAEQGTFHHARGGHGGSPFLPVPLADKFGLSKGLPGLVEWGIGALEDMVLGPLETAAWAALGQTPPGAAGMGAGGLGGAFGYPNAAGFTPDVPAGTFGPGGDVNAPGMGGPSRDNMVGPAAAGAGAAASSTPTPSPWWGGWHPGNKAQTAAPSLWWGGAKPWWGGWQPKPGTPEWFNSLLTGPAQGTPGMQPGAGLGPDDNNIPGLTAGALAARGGKAISDWLHGHPLGMSGIGGPRPGFRQMQVPPYTAPPPPPQPGLPPDVASFFVPGAQHHATGGPIGTDTIPAWLSPHEFVEQTSAVDKYGDRFMSALNQGLIDPSSVRYFSGGGDSIGPEPQPAPEPPKPQGAVKMPGPGTQQPKVPGAPKPGEPAPKPGPKPGGMGATDIHQGISDLTTPGADAQQPGMGQPAQPGIGFSGGFIGAAESAAASAGSMFPGGSAAGAAMQVGFQELNRAAAAGAQYAGIGVEGLLESLIPDAGGSSADWSKTIPGRLLMGVTGVRPSASQNTAGQTQQPFASNASGDKFANPDGNVQGQAPIQILGPVHIQADNTKQMHSELNQQTDMAANRFGVSQR